MSAPPPGRSDVILLVIALACGVFFFSMLHRLWPLAETDLNAPPARLTAEAKRFLEARDIDTSRHAAATRLTVDSAALDYLLRHFGRETTQQFIREGFPIFLYEVRLKRRGDPDALSVEIHPEKGIVSWGRSVQEDAPGAVLEVEAARQTAVAGMAAAAGVPLDDLEPRGAIERLRPSRSDHTFIFERHVSREPELRERVSVTVAGGELSSVRRELVVPESARRDARSREASVVALQMAGFLLVALGGLGAVAIFLSRLARGEILLRRAAGPVALIALFFLVTQALRTADLLMRWDPLWPRAVATLQTLGFALADGAWIALALFVVIAAGDALDRESGAERGRSLWKAARGNLADPEVGIASLRGFLVGLICGATLVASVLLLEGLAGAEVAIQPQGFFFFALNSAFPAVSTLLYFLMVAMVEELGYRYFAGTWLMNRTRRLAVAIAIPAILYGTTHTGLPFLPPYEPFWGRAIAFTLVGAVWGWAFFRYDALTVVLSHFTADLFIFNWPRLGSGDPLLVAKAIATIAVPLVPALLLLARRSGGGWSRDATIPQQE
jgi:hypothetical protein